MSKIKIILTVFLPSLLITAFMLYCYISAEIRSGIRTQMEVMEDRVAKFGESITTNAENISRQTNVYATLLSSPEGTDIPSLLSKTMEEIPAISDFIVAYDPNFLKEVQAGKHPDFKLNKYFGKMAPDSPPAEFASVIYRDESGHLVFTNETGHHYWLKDWYLIPKMGREGRWSTPMLIRQSSTSRVSTYGRPFYYGDTMAGVVVCCVKMDSLVELNNTEQKQEFSQKYGGRFFIIGPHGRIFYHTENVLLNNYSMYSLSEELGMPELFPQVDKMVHDISGTITVPYVFTNTDLASRNDDMTWYIYNTPRSEARWTLVGAFSEKTLLAPLYHNLILVSIAVLLSISVICTIVTILLIRANEPIIEMTQVAESVAAGNLDVAVRKRYEHKPGIMGRFVRSFNGMIISLRENIQKAVNESSQRLAMEKELLIAQNLQETFLPNEHFIQSEKGGFVIDSRLIPAKYVAGDFFDFWDVNEHTKAVLIADVSGKGISASMIMVVARTIIRQLTNKDSIPGEVLTQANAILQESNQNGMFITLFLAFYDTQSGILQYCNAGHNPPILIRANGAIEMFNYAASPLLGIMPGIDYLTEEISMDVNDVLFLYTDGVTDTTDKDGKQFGFDAMCNLLSEQADVTIEKFLPNIFDTLTQYCGPTQADDITAVVLKRIPKT